MISIASWAADVRLTIDWRALGIDPARATLAAPEVEGFQPAATFSPDGLNRVPKGKGWLLNLS